MFLDMSIFYRHVLLSLSMVLYCWVLPFFLLYCYCIVKPYSMVNYTSSISLYCIVLHCIVCCFISLYFIILYYIVLHCIEFFVVLTARISKTLGCLQRFILLSSSNKTCSITDNIWKLTELDIVSMLMSLL